MSVDAAVMTGKGLAAISTILVRGRSSHALVESIFRPVSGPNEGFDLQPGRVLAGVLKEDDLSLDQVAIAREATDLYAIHCHGNPLIIETVMEMLQNRGARVITPECMLSAITEPENSIALEAAVAVPGARTLSGVKLLEQQATDGLSRVAGQWRTIEQTENLDGVKSRIQQILNDSKSARLIINGCTAVLTGPPNSGKSTLLNLLSGRQAAMVTDISGTTRDYVTAQCRIEPLSITLVDTAGLDGLAQSGKSVDAAAQSTSRKMLEEAELILVVLDSSRPSDQLQAIHTQFASDAEILPVLNKSDLPAKLVAADLLKPLSRPVRISATERTGIDNLQKQILEKLAVNGLSHNTPVCFTERQQEILCRMLETNAIDRFKDLAGLLLNGAIAV